MGYEQAVALLRLFLFVSRRKRRKCAEIRREAFPLRTSMISTEAKNRQYTQSTFPRFSVNNKVQNKDYVKSVRAPAFVHSFLIKPKSTVPKPLVTILNDAVIRNHTKKLTR